MKFQPIEWARKRLRALLSGTAKPDQWLVDWCRGGPATASGEAVNESSALACAAVKACVTILSETLASTTAVEPLVHNVLEGLLHRLGYEAGGVYVPPPERPHSTGKGWRERRRAARR